MSALDRAEAALRASQRGELERQLARALDCPAEMQLAKDEAEATVEASLLDPYRQRTCRGLMQAYAATGNRAKTLSAYHELRELLSEELGTEPEPATQALYLKLQDKSYPSTS